MASIDEVYENIQSDIDVQSYSTSDSEIGKFFARKTIFITGVTGYLGKLLLEKILRSCTDVKHVYVLMRERSQESLEERKSKYFQNLIFDRLKEKYPNFQDKVTVLKGDLSAKNLGLSDEDRIKIINNVNIIYHNGANVKFDARPSAILRVNVLGTMQMLELAQECKNIELFVYVSTAYSHCYRREIAEEFYSPPADIKTVYETIEADEQMENGMSPEAVQKMIGKHPNIYTYSKAIAENLVKEYGQYSKFAHAIYRPSIATSTHQEPVPGWCGNFNGPVYVFLAGFLGYFHTGYHHREIMDFIPSDMTINALLAISWDAQNQWKNNQEQAVVFNYGSSTTNPIALLEVNEIYDRVVTPLERSAKAVWLNYFVIAGSFWLFYVYHTLLHFLPACLLDGILMLSGKKPKAVSIFWKATKHIDKAHYFANGNWRIYIRRTLDVIDKMSPVDHEIFNCDIRKLSWEEHIKILWRGYKHYILKEEICSEAGRRNYYRLWYMHYGFITVCLLTFCYYLFKFVTAVF